jgi:hypothetical protein
MFDYHRCDPRHTNPFKRRPWGDQLVFWLVMVVVLSAAAFR